jgi:signal transduction histidine kinase
LVGITFSYRDAPYSWLSLLTAIFLISLSVYSWRRRSMPGALPFALGSLLAALWSLSSAMKYAATDVATKEFWIQFQALWQLPAITAITCFFLEFAWPGRWLTRRNIALLSIAPVLVALAVVTNDVYHLGWRSFVVNESVTAQVSPITWFMLAYSIGLGFINMVVLVWLFWRSPQHRWPAAIMIAGQVAFRTVLILQQTAIARSALPLDILAVGSMFLVYAIVLFSFHLFDPMPMARQIAIEQLYAGMLVLDSDGRVVSLNPSAERILSVPTNLARRRPIKELLPDYPDGPLRGSEETEIQLSLKVGQRARDYALAISPLRDWRGLHLGQLLLLRDVTKEKMAQRQLLEQARALAALQERDRVARELHDDLGQTLGYVKMQAQTAREHLAQNQTDAAGYDLAQLTAVVQDVHEDVRDYILGARSGQSVEPGLLPALTRYLQRFGESYGIRTELVSPPELPEEAFEPTVEVQLLRIIQEALANARKHAHARLVQVSICSQDGRAQVTGRTMGSGLILRYSRPERARSSGCV